MVQKPDLVAPGVEVMTATTGGGYAAFTGTSFATPFVTGSGSTFDGMGDCERK